MKKIAWILILFFVCVQYPAQNRKDTLESWMSQFYRLSNPVISETGVWAAIRKRYDTQQDTLIVVNTQKPDAPPLTIVLNGTSVFLKDDGILVSGNGNAEFVNLRSRIKNHFDNVTSVYSLPKERQYGVLTKDSVLSIYTIAGIRKYRISGIQALPAADPGKSIYLCRKFNQGYEIIGISGRGIRKLAVTQHPAESLELSPSGKQLILVEKNNTGHSKLIFINTSDGRLVTLPFVSTKDADYCKVAEIQDGKAYLVALNSVEKPEIDLVDIWYGNDHNLRSKKIGATTGRYWLYLPESGQFRELPNIKYPVMASLNSTRYFLAYHPTLGNNYLTYEPQFYNTHIYDIEQKSYHSFASLKGVTYGSPEIICSPNGELVLGSKDGRRWILFNLENQTRYEINKDGLQNPVFSDNNQEILFESNDDLWKFNIKEKELTRTKVGEGKTIKIVNVNVYKFLHPTHIEERSIDMSKPLLLETVDRAENLTSYSIWKNNTVKEIVSRTKNKVRNIVYDDRVSNIFTLEENYNMAPRLFFKKGNQKNVLNFERGSYDEGSGLLKQDIIHFVTADGIPLKGILYYPAKFTHGKKYPLVVHIYQIQSPKSNEYHIPGYNNADGLDIRVLTERGYFVLLPDTVVGPKGAGLSALDCVNRALDVVSGNSSVDMEKVGLIGHSFGGYETNFIATQSNRFAAYISGAGDSDIIQSYFSYNYHYPGPHYWQFESGIYDMPPFVAAKDTYFRNNPINFVEKINAPILLWTGQKDQNVPWMRTMEFYVGLVRNQKPVVALFYPDGRHTLGFNSKEKKDLYQRVLEWWDYFLKDRKNIPWIDKQIKRDATQ